MLDLLKDVDIEDFAEEDLVALRIALEELEATPCSFEKDVRRELSEKIESVAALKEAAELAKKYRPISMGFMIAHNMIRTKIGTVAVPRFCPFSMEDNRFFICVMVDEGYYRDVVPWPTGVHIGFNYEDGNRAILSAPALNRALFRSVTSEGKLRAYLRYSGSSTLENRVWTIPKAAWRNQNSNTICHCSVSFVMPDRTKKKIAEATEFSHPFIIAEVPADQWNASTVRLADDPLVIGFRGEHAYLIDAFDPTPLEQYVMREF